MIWQRSPFDITSRTADTQTKRICGQPPQRRASKMWMPLWPMPTTRRIGPLWPTKLVSTRRRVLAVCRSFLSMGSLSRAVLSPRHILKTCSSVLLWEISAFRFCDVCARCVCPGSAQSKKQKNCFGVLVTEKIKCRTMTSLTVKLSPSNEGWATHGVQFPVNCTW